MTIKDLKPELIWKIFDEINQVPRPSKKEEKIREYLVQFAQKNNIKYKVDAIGNVAMWRPAAPGYENVKGVVLQGHMDMVAEKVAGSSHNFDTDPIKTIVDGEWLRADGTTLGADDGMGMAGALAAMVDPDLKVGPLEAFFTVDEETGLTGASNVGEGMLTGDYLLNMDSEDDGVITIGCSGGVDTLASFNFKPAEAPKDYVYFHLKVSKLMGGHSGTDINAERGNATRFIARLLWRIDKEIDFQLADINAGNLRNALAHTAEATIGVPEADKEKLAVIYNTYVADLKNEYKIEKDMLWECNSVDAPATVIEKRVALNVINAAYVAPHGVQSMSLAVPGLVESSTNLASIKIHDGNRIEIVTSQRSDVESRKFDVAHRVETIFKIAGADEVRHTDGYQGWTPNPESALLKIAVEQWEGLYGVKPKIEAIHAGLECGLFLKVAPHMEMISYGPTLRDVHSPKERVHIPAVQKFWDFTVAILKAVAKA